jgi:hypothetical protein
MCESLPLFSTFQLPLILKSKQIFTGILHGILSPGHNKKNHRIFFTYSYPIKSLADVGRRGWEKSQKTSPKHRNDSRGERSFLGRSIVL